jgi:Zn-dependent oligopeptidase
MLENWCWEGSILRKLSAHYSRTDPKTGLPERIPKELCDKIVKAKNVNAGLQNLRQIFFGSFDLNVHTAEGGVVDTTKVWEDLKPEITLIPNAPGTYPAASFGHVMGGCTYFGPFLRAGRGCRTRNHILILGV